MRKINILLYTTVICLGISGSTFGKELLSGSNPGQSTSGGTSKPSGPSFAAGCAAANASTDLELNNVRAIIHTGGDFWMNRNASPSVAGYEVPKNSKKFSIFAGALWMGGVDVNGQLKLAAQRFRSQGNDFWPGPLNTQTVEIDAATCAKYDKHFVSERSAVEKFNRWFEMSVDDPAGLALDPEFAGYSIPKFILDWPAHGNVSNSEDYYLAPFFDRNGDGNYNPYDGDYPGFELIMGENDCRVSREVNLYGDMNFWWVFNDKGNIHTETGGAAIGMEIRGQAFSFSTNDEINSMTFYNFELVNRSTFVLENTYFGIWADPDLGRFDDDYVGCDVQRGLGYCYNGKDVDGSGGPGDYGANPPAVGIDFFEGPYQDNDGTDNPGPSNNFEYLTYAEAKAGNGIPYRGLGIGYGDGIVDNERFGMSRFLYHNNQGGGSHPATTDPLTASDYYNYLRGIWRDNTPMRYGGNGHTSGPTTTAEECNYMFPGGTDPVGWGTKGNTTLTGWTEESEGNVPWDRRFAQSAGPFKLKPGAANNITLGVVWARAISGGPMASVLKLKVVDDKAQALFDNCFRIVNGPDAPDVSVRELDKELILLLSNRKGS
ncbi:MAG: T9SS C-terminal target domain-containing protein, partial [Bacteroidetes bacterium]|nr:T9SS C-terminal target domain-containing protein [Bacteroidota bacterium]